VSVVFIDKREDYCAWEEFGLNNNFRSINVIFFAHCKIILDTWNKGAE